MKERKKKRPFQPLILPIRRIPSPPTLPSGATSIPLLHLRPRCRRRRRRIYRPRLHIRHREQIVVTLLCKRENAKRKKESIINVRSDKTLETLTSERERGHRRRPTLLFCGSETGGFRQEEGWSGWPEAAAFMSGSDIRRRRRRSEESGERVGDLGFWWKESETWRFEVS